MSHWNPLENQLRSWKPRAPSPSLEARLFPQPPLETAAGGLEAGLLRQRRHDPDAWHWLAPAMAVFVLGVFAFGNHPGALEHFNPPPSATALTTAALEQPAMSTYFASVRHSDNNALRSTFEWTNGSHSLRTAPPMAQTNTVIQ